VDEFDFEVTPLNTRTASRAAPAEDDSADNSPLHPWIERRLGWRQRLSRMGGLVAVVTFALVALLLVPSGSRNGIRTLLPVPTPTTLLLTGNDRFAWEHTVPWGKLFIDGQPGPVLSATGANFKTTPELRPVSFRLSPGRHTLDYRADLFPTLHCVVSVPQAASDTCPLDHQIVDFLFPDAALTRVLDLGATIERLPPGQVQALAHATQELLDATTATQSGIIEPGDHLLNTDGEVATADEPMLIAPHFTPSQDTAVSHPELTAHCARLCSATEAFDPSGPDTWNLIAPVDLTWRYQTLAGQSILDEGPSMPRAAQQSADVSVEAAWKQGQWRVSLAPLSPRTSDLVICATGSHYLEVMQASEGTDTTPDPNFRWRWPYAASTRDLGCLFAGSNTLDDSGTPTGHVALVLYRCGVLLAANEEAHRLFPRMPLPSAHERALIQEVTPTWAKTDGSG